MKIKSVIAGEYTAPPAQGPMIIEIWGITPVHLIHIDTARSMVYHNDNFA
jgi:hypothetical protein